MPTQVEIPLVGTVEFPDEMSADDISTASSRLYAQAGGKPPSMSVSDTARLRQQGSMGAEKIGKTSGPGVLGALKDSYLGQAGDRLTQNYNRAVSGVKRFASNPVEDIAQTVAHPATDSGMTDAMSGILGMLTSGFAPLGAGPAEITRGASELSGIEPQAARQMGNRAAQATEMIAGGLPLIQAPAEPGAAYAQNVADAKAAAEPSAIDNARQGAARYLAKSALKPGKSHGSPEQIGKAIDLQLEQGFKPEDYDTKAEAYRNQVGSGIRQTYAQVDQPTVDTGKIVDAIKKTRDGLLPSEPAA